MKDYSGKSVLVAEDDKFISELIVGVLKDKGITPHIAMDGEEAIEVLENVHVDLLLLDILMPKKDGYDVLRFMKDKSMNTPVIVVTNLDHADDVQRTASYNCKEHIIKSDIDVDTLWQRVAPYLK